MMAETVKDVDETADKTLDFYDKLLDRVIPYDDFKTTLNQLDEFR